jgi:hypothetical protein
MIPSGTNNPPAQCFYHWVDTSAGGLFVPQGIIRPVVSASILIWFIRYLFFFNYHWADTPAGGLFVPEGIIRPVPGGQIIHQQRYRPNDRNTDYWAENTLGDK